MAFWLWAGFIVVIASLIALDLGGLPRRARVVPIPEAAAWTATWVILALVFNVGIVFL